MSAGGLGEAREVGTDFQVAWCSDHAKDHDLTLFVPSRMTQNRTSLEFFVSRLALKSLPLGLPSTKALT